MDSVDEIKQLITTINDLVECGKADEQGVDFWSDAGARVLLFIESIVQNPEKVNSLTPREYSKDNECLLATNFIVLEKLGSYANEPFTNNIWNQFYGTTSGEQNDDAQDTVVATNIESYYELSITRCCSWLCQLLGDRFKYIQKLLIRNIFGNSDICSLFASDMYMFLLRLVHPNNRMSMCQLIMNMCKMAPPEALVKGAALINRIKHPIVNFENSNYQYLLDFS